MARGIGSTASRSTPRTSAWSTCLERHHIFPQAVLYANGYSSANRVHVELVNELANLAFLTKQANIKISNADPLSYLREIKANDPEALEAQFIPMDEIDMGCGPVH